MRCYSFFSCLQPLFFPLFVSSGCSGHSGSLGERFFDSFAHSSTMRVMKHRATQLSRSHKRLADDLSEMISGLMDDDSEGPGSPVGVGNAPSSESVAAEARPSHDADRGEIVTSESAQPSVHNTAEDHASEGDDLATGNQSETAVVDGHAGSDDPSGRDRSPSGFSANDAAQQKIEFHRKMSEYAMLSFPSFLLFELMLACVLVVFRPVKCETCVNSQLYIHPFTCFVIHSLLSVY